VDERNKKQFNIVRKQLNRPDVNRVVNACDAGREGELIFALCFEQAKCDLPVDRLWLASMTKQAISDAFGHLRPGTDLEPLESAARSRQEADWIVGMNATRAATIRLRTSFDGAVSLGRVQTPTLAILARREEEIAAHVPVPYWQVSARFSTAAGEVYSGVLHGEHGDRLPEEHLADEAVAACSDGTGTIVRVETRERRDKAPLLFDLTSLQREASSRYGFTARRTLSAAQKLYEQHKALSYPRTNSRYLTGDMIPEIKPIASVVGRTAAEYTKAADFVVGLDSLPLGKVVNDEKVGDHHAIIPTNTESHPIAKFSEDERKIYDMVARRFLAVFHPESVAENTTLETEVAGNRFRTRGRVLTVPGWRGIDGDSRSDELLPKLEEGESVAVMDVEGERKETKPPQRYSDGKLLEAMETAGKEVEDEEAREAMKESGIGTPATRAGIIETLIARGYIERDGRALVCTEKGVNVIRLLGDHPLTSPALTGSWEARLEKIAKGEERREAFMGDIAAFAKETVTMLDERLDGVRIPRANLGPCPVCGHDIMENRKGYSCWAKDDPGCGFVIWKAKAGKTLTAQIVRELIRTGRSEKQVTGFKSRAGKSFRAKLAMYQNEEGRWRVEFDEPWAKEGAKPPEPEDAESGTASPAAVAPAPEKAPVKKKAPAKKKATAKKKAPAKRKAPASEPAAEDPGP
ncbi:MAG: DNA topoisomerase, partial [Actinomycetes bacterium]